MTEGYKAPICVTCGHLRGDHGSAWTPPLKPVVGGPCHIQGCDCRRFLEEKELDRAAA